MRSMSLRVQGRARSNMRIVLLNQFFWPDTAPTSEYATDLAEHLASKGHDVSVVCGTGAYGPRSDRPRPAVEIHRVPTFSFRHSRWSRILSYLSFYVGCLYSLLRMRRVDCVVSMTTPPLLGLLGRIVQIVRGSRHICWEMDAYPEVATDLGELKPFSLAGRALASLSLSIRSNADRVVVLGPCMRERLQRSGVPEQQVATVENWADPQLIWFQPLEIGEPLRVLYSGNLGRAHDVETILDVIGHPELDPRVQFVFAVSESQMGVLRERVRPFASRCQVRALEPRAQFGNSLAACEIGLVTLNAACLGALVPSKLYGLLAAGRPVLFIGPGAATPARTVAAHQCGWTVPNGESGAIVRLLNALAGDRDALRAAAARARNAFEQHYTKEYGLLRLERAIILADRMTPAESEPCWTEV